MTTLNVSLAGSSPPSAQASRYAALLSADAMDGLRGQEAVLRSLAACAKRIGGGGHGVIGCSPPGAFTMRNRLLWPARHCAGNTNPKMRRGAVLLVTRPCLAACHARYSAVYVCRQSQRPAWACRGLPTVHRTHGGPNCGARGRVWPCRGQRARHGRLTWHIGMGLPARACQAHRLGTELRRIGGICFDMDTPPQGFTPSVSVPDQSRSTPEMQRGHFWLVWAGDTLECLYQQGPAVGRLPCVQLERRPPRRLLDKAQDPVPRPIGRRSFSRATSYSIAPRTNRD